VSAPGEVTTTRSVDRTCDNCGFEGFVDVWVDRGIHATGWTCPDCKAEQSGDLEDLREGYGDRYETEWEQS
jgi:predicted RNA-binding Zn-ribbon protein involved in translation (DUF1610 family)